MPGDYTRIPPKTRGLTLMQQGRVLVDADWNELVRTNDRTRRVETIDTVGRAVYPVALPESFHVTLDGSTSPATVLLGLGRYYVDGLLAENAGVPATFDNQSEELVGSAPIPLSKQPYLAPGLEVAISANATGTFLAVLDVWQREVSVYEDPALLDPAIGFDTSTRLETAWQVRLLPVAGSPDCSTPDGQIPELGPLFAPSGGRLSTAAVGPVTSDDPCAVSAQGGYRGVDNRLYRVEIHDPGTSLADATFKWSRDNASVAASVLGTNAKRLTVQRTGRDAYLKLRVGDTVEVTCDERELARSTGDIAHVVAVNDVDGLVDLDLAPAADLVSGTHVRVRRWDGGPLPVASGTTPTPILLEDGVQVTLELTPGGKFHVGDYWCFTARAADGSVETLAAAPPLGTHHHYARLATLTLTGGQGSATDCRVPWPPATGSARDDCACTLCVSPAEHNAGQHTLYDAVAAIAKTGGRICLLPGEYRLPKTLALDGVSNVEIVGQGSATTLVGPGPTISVTGAAHVALFDFAVTAKGDAVSIKNTVDVTLARLGLTAPGGAAVNADGILEELVIEECTLDGDNGVTIGGAETFALLAMVAVRSNLFTNIAATGVRIFAETIYLTDVIIADNVFFFATNTTGKLTQQGVVFDGHPLTGAGVARVQRNEVWGGSRGVVASYSLFDVSDNTFTNVQGSLESSAAIVLSAAALADDGDGLVAQNDLVTVTNGILFQNFAPAAVVRVLDNTFEGVTGAAIVQVRSAIAAIVEVRRNSLILVAAGSPGVVSFQNVAALTIERNTVVVSSATSGVKSAYGIWVRGGKWVSIENNDLFVDVASEESCTAIRVDGTSDDVQVVGNRLLNVGALAPSWSGIVVNANVAAAGAFDVLEELQAEPNAAKIVALAERMRKDPDVFVQALQAVEAGHIPAGAVLRGPNVRVDGNTLVRSQMTEGIHVSRARRVMVSGNRCQASALNDSPGLVAVNDAFSALVNGNEVLTSANLAAFTWNGVTKLVFSSNVVTGTIAPPLPPVWQPLNIVN
jgi:hypothetical protein